MSKVMYENNILIYALHGFLGKSSDWNQFYAELGRKLESEIKTNFNIHFKTPDLFDPRSSAELSIENFIDDVIDIQKQVDYSKKIFIGYSLGGRLGLQILEKYPDFFDHYVFISTHFGLSTDQEKQERLQNDSEWSHKLLTLSWQDFISAWAAQVVFTETNHQARFESEYDKNKLNLALKKYSLGNQPDYAVLIEKNNKKVSWIVGNNDSKFLKLAEDLKQKKILLDYKRIFSGHRVLFDNPTELSQVMYELITN